MPLNRRRFILLSGLAVGTSSAFACSQSSPKASARSSAATASPTSNSTNASPPPNRVALGPDGLFAPQRGDIRIAIISDLNSAYGSTDYLPEVANGLSLLPDWQPDLVLCGGDMVAGQSLDLSAPQIEAMWNAFDEKVLSPIRTAGLPFAVTVGNHDASSYQNNGEFIYILDRQATAKYWAGHQSDTDIAFIEATAFPFYYSFKQNNIFYLIWDASSANIPAEQVAWADRALSSPEAQSADRRIVMGHLPLYAVAQKRDRPGEFLNQADELRALLERHNVHTYISGHHHAYFPGKAGQLNTLHAGALGSGPKALLNSTAEPFQTLTIMDLFLDTASTVYTTYDMNTLTVVDPQSLPAEIVGPNGREQRQDLASISL